MFSCVIVMGFDFWNLIRDGVLVNCGVNCVIKVEFEFVGMLMIKNFLLLIL